MTKYLIVSLAFFISSCANLQSKSGQEDLLFNPTIAGQSFEVSIISNGCTSPEHFYLTVSEAVIEMRRTQADLCRAAPHLVRLSFSYPFDERVYEIKNEVRFSNRIERR